jgi:hypothetical protein
MPDLSHFLNGRTRIVVRDFAAISAALSVNPAAVMRSESS